MLKSRWSVTSLAVAICLFILDSASAGYLGIANYRNCGIAEPESICESQVQTHTIMRTRRRVVFDQQQYTCYKTVYDTVVDTKDIECAGNCTELPYDSSPCRIRWALHTSRKHVSSVF